MVKSVKSNSQIVSPQIHTPRELYSPYSVQHPASTHILFPAVFISVPGAVLPRRGERAPSECTPLGGVQGE